MRSLSIWFSSIPLIALIGIEIYVSNVDGWGAWGAAPLLVLPALAGFAISLIGVFDLFGALKSNLPVGRSVLVIIFALSPVFWLLIRRFVL